MVLSWIWAGMVSLSVIAALVLGKGGMLSSAVMAGAQQGVTLVISMAGAVCLWSGVGRLMEAAGVTAKLSKLLRPILARLFPTTRHDPDLAGDLSANICANFLGLGNAATPMGIQAARRLAARSPGAASHELCRLIVLNTASIQLIPTNVAALRAALGCLTPFDLLVPVWVTSACSAGVGLCAAWLLGKVWKNG